MYFRDLRITIRTLARSAGFTTTVVLMLALGIGATTSIFSLVEGVLLRPLPFPDPARLVSLSDVFRGAGLPENTAGGVAAPEVVAYRLNPNAFESLAGYLQTTYELSGIGEPAEINGTRVTADIFGVLQVSPFIGRSFTKEEDEAHAPVAILSYGLWKSRMHGDPTVLGAKIQLDRQPYTVIGVMPRNFEFPLVPGQMNNTELWVPMSFTNQELTKGSTWAFKMIGRLKPNNTPEQAEANAQQVAQEMMRNSPSMENLHIAARVRPLLQQTVGPARRLVQTLFFCTFVVLLIVCVNSVGLLLVRAIRHRPDNAVRLALGAGAATLLRKTILEGLVLSTAGGLLGIVLAAILVKVGVSHLPETMPRVHEIRLDWHVLLFATGIVLLVGIICGTIPAVASLRTRVNEHLKDGGRTGGLGTSHAPLRSALVVGEIAIALMLLAGSGLLLRSFEKMRSIDLGFRPDHVLVGAYTLPPAQYQQQTAVDNFNDQLLEQLQRLPGVKTVGVSSSLPQLGGVSRSSFVAEGYTPPAGAALNFIAFSMVKGDYFRAIGVPLRRGRFFNSSDTADTELVGIVNEKVAEYYWPGSNPIGKRLRFGTQSMQMPWITIIGEVADVKDGPRDEPTKEQFYQPIDQFKKSLGSKAPSGVTGNSCYVALRTEIDPEQLASSLRTAVHSIDSQLPITQIQTMEDAITDGEGPRRFLTVLILALAGAAVSLAALGVYGVVAFSTVLRTQEMAVRMALGSTTWGILKVVFTSAIRLAVAGSVLGLLGTLAVSRMLRSFLFEVSAFDPLSLAAATIFMLILALVASLLPARYAASLSPLQCLRQE
jgi:putative ABC transport system permease protein